ncbi:MAG TPA: glycoside hydrolase family 6 protein [Actinomycetota bacterium]|jgi:endoglucanase|nr:glycoside hydrolase family 6 protein [Actinomycetota bacterium]
MQTTAKLCVALGVIAAAIGRLAVDATAANMDVEAETFSLPSNSGQVYADSAASGGQALLIWSNATASKQVSTPSFTQLQVRARGDQCKGAPKMTVALNGAAVMTNNVKATSWTTYSVTLSRPAGPYNVGLSFSNDHVSGGCDRNLRVDKVTFVNSSTSTPSPTVTPTPAPTQAPPPPQSSTMYVDPNSNAKQQADAWRSSRPDDAAQMDKIAGQPQAFWFGDWSGDVRASVNNVMTAANGKLVTLVAYNIPQRDCGGFSGGGTTADGYRSWIRAFADGIGSRQAIVVIEPDALANMTCLSEADQSTRLSLLSDAVSVLKSKPATSAYLDAGHSAWLTPSEAARRLNMANVSQANGFSLNVSNFRTTSESVNYGNQVSAQTGGKHFIVDTSRNGLGPTSDNQWCNPPGRALGDRPTLTTGQPLADAYLWVKRPGESDGQCNGGPPAGQWWADYALGLAQRAAY